MTKPPTLARRQACTAGTPMPVPIIAPCNPGSVIDPNRERQSVCVNAARPDPAAGTDRGRTCRYHTARFSSAAAPILT